MYSKKLIARKMLTQFLSGHRGQFILFGKLFLSNHLQPPSKFFPNFFFNFIFQKKKKREIDLKMGDTLFFGVHKIRDGKI